MKHLQALVLESLIPVYETADVVMKLFDVTCDPAHRARRGDIGRAVAAATGTEYSPRIQRRTNHALKTLGLTRGVRTHGTPWVIGIRDVRHQ